MLIVDINEEDKIIVLDGAQWDYCPTAMQAEEMLLADGITMFGEPVRVVDVTSDSWTWVVECE